MLWAFFDESGKLADLDFMCLCGYIAGENNKFSWDSFSNDWRSVLQHEGMPFLHTTSLFANRAPYDQLGWHSRKKNEVLSDLARAISRNVLAGIGIALDARHYRSLLRDKRQLIGDNSPELFLFDRLMRKMTDITDKWGDPDPLSITFDWSEDFANKCLQPLYQVPPSATHVGDSQGEENVIHRGKREGVCHGGSGSPSGGLRRGRIARSGEAVCGCRSDPTLVGSGGDL